MIKILFTLYNNSY